MGKRKILRLMPLIVALGLPLLLAHPVFAADGSVGQVENFIRSVNKVLVGLSVVVATSFFIGAGFIYITSTGNPDRMDKAKRTLIWTAVGLAIAIGAVVLGNIVLEISTKAFGA
jgi:hypothetical protein